MSLEKTEAAREVSRRAKLPYEEKLSLELDELIGDLSKISLSNWKLLVATLLRLVAAEMKTERDRLLAKAREGD